MCVQRALEINLLHSRGKEETEDLENFKKDITELNKLLITLSDHL
jgi:hypothetical protein